MKRKAIKLASNTLVISLPADWVRRKKLEKGDSIDLEEFEGKLILSSKKISPEGRIYVNISGMDPMIKRILGAFYKSGYDEVKVSFSSIKELKTIQEVIREEFLGFEVIDQKKDYLIFKKVSHIEPREFHNMLRRMFLIILSMADDSLEAIQKRDKEWLKAIALHDKDVNKIADFCRRVLNTTGAEGFKRNPPAYFIVEQLEKIGDLYRDICTYHCVNPKRMSKKMIKLYSDINKFFRDFYKLFFGFDMDLLKSFARSRDLLKKRFDDSLSEKDVKTLILLFSVLESTFDMNGSLMAVNF